MQKIKSLIGIAIALTAWIAFAAYILIGVNSEVLYTAQDRNVFVGATQFFSETIAQPFGLFKYIGAFLTQLFYHPALGATVLIAFWVAIILAGIKAFRLKGIWTVLMILPVACLLAATVDLGYWIYCLNIHGYWFSQSAAMLSLLLLLWAANATPRRHRIAWYVVIGLIAFPVFGWFSYLFVVCLSLIQWQKGAKTTWVDYIGIALAAVAPIIFSTLLYKGISLTNVYLTGFPLFKTSTDETLRPSLPFLLMAGILIILSLSGIFAQLLSEKVETLPKRIKAVGAITLPCLIIAVSAYGVWASMFKDDNYIYEMQMNRATMNDDWKGVISVAENAEHPSQTMVMLKNIALINTGELGERSFQLGNSGIDIYNPDSLHVNIMQIAAPAIYLNHGQYNYAMRWCMEFAVSYGFSPYYMKIMARSAAATGEKKLEHRFTERLHSMLYYSDWKPADISPCAKELSKVSGNVLGWDDNNCERFIIKTFSRSHGNKSPLLSEVCLFYTLISREQQDFWTAFQDYLATHKDEGLPTHYGEAFILFASKDEEKSKTHVKILNETVTKYKEYWTDGNRYAGMFSDAKTIGEAMAEAWDDTYWWYAAFGRSNY